MMNLILLRQNPNQTLEKILDYLEQKPLLTFFCFQEGVYFIDTLVNEDKIRHSIEKQQPNIIFCATSLKNRNLSIDSVPYEVKIGTLGQFAEMLHNSDSFVEM